MNIDASCQAIGWPNASPATRRCCLQPSRSQSQSTQMN